MPGTEQSVRVGDGILKTNKHWGQNSQLELQVTLYRQVSINRGRNSQSEMEMAYKRQENTRD